jgi:hypothetical protein
LFWLLLLISLVDIVAANVTVVIIVIIEVLVAATINLDVVVC